MLSIRGPHRRFSRRRAAVTNTPYWRGVRRPCPAVGADDERAAERERKQGRVAAFLAAGESPSRRKPWDHGPYQWKPAPLAVPLHRRAPRKTPRGEPAGLVSGQERFRLGAVAAGPEKPAHGGLDLQPLGYRQALGDAGQRIIG